MFPYLAGMYLGNVIDNPRLKLRHSSRLRRWVGRG
jgi:hypothetical protein